MEKKRMEFKWGSNVILIFIQAGLYRSKIYINEFGTCFQIVYMKYTTPQFILYKCSDFR
nr:MAG TPA: hypothetical protein [Caudoviricetes sp.]DAM28781.1 MAG TPA: hypothetical protein [Caudoviricetes sp.]